MEPFHLDGYVGSGPGPVVGHETDDLDLTLLAWPEHHSIPSHINGEVDVVTVVLSGLGEAIVNGTRHELRLGSVLIIPKDAERSIKSLSPDFRYLNVHRRRKRLMPSIG